MYIFILGLGITESTSQRSIRQRNFLHVKVVYMPVFPALGPSNSDVYFMFRQTNSVDLKEDGHDELAVVLLFEYKNIFYFLVNR